LKSKSREQVVRKVFALACALLYLDEMRVLCWKYGYAPIQSG
jgi:hypothetical protein